MSTTMTAIFCVIGFVLGVAYLIGVLGSEEHYYKCPWLWERTAYLAWKKAYKSDLYARPKECSAYEEFVGLGEKWWAYVHIPESDLICLLYKNEIQTDEKIRVAILKKDGIPNCKDDTVVFTHFWQKHADKLVEKALVPVIENYKKAKNETD